MYKCICVYKYIISSKINIYIYTYLVGGIPTPLKNMKVNWDDAIHNIWNRKQRSKPPTKYIYIYTYMIFNMVKLCA